MNIVIMCSPNQKKCIFYISLLPKMHSSGTLMPLLHILSTPPDRTFAPFGIWSIPPWLLSPAQCCCLETLVPRWPRDHNNTVNPPSNAPDSKGWACATFLFATAGKTESVPIQAAAFGVTVTFLHFSKAAANMWMLVFTEECWNAFARDSTHTL